MDYTPKHLELFDRILNFCIQKRQSNCSCNLFIQINKAERLSAEFAYNEVCRIGNEIGFFTSVHFGNGDWGIISKDYLYADLFKKHGGFAGYFKVKDLVN